MRQLAIVVAVSAIIAACVAVAFPQTIGLPTHIPSRYGPVPVVLVENPPDVRGRRVDGIWSRDTRRITIRGTLHLEHQRMILEHERCHVAMDDYYIGKVRLDEATEDHICNAIMWQSRLR